MVPGLVFLLFSEGEVHQMTGKLVHFPCGFPVVPLCRPLVVPCSVWTIGGKCRRFVEIWFTFPVEKWQNDAEINIFEGKVHQMTGKLVHFPDTDEMILT